MHRSSATAIILLFLLALCRQPAARAEDDAGIEPERPAAAQSADRARLARGIYFHDFENRRDPDTGEPLPESAALNTEGRPDFWEPVRAVGFPEYLIPGIRIVTDASGQIPGAYRDEANHVLRMDFDGTRVGVRTRWAVPVDPKLSYEFSLLERDSDLAGARIRAGVEWLRIDADAVAVLRADELGDLRPGQTDWPVTPFRMLINDPPDNANAARLFVLVERRPDSIGGAYHGTLWLDNIGLRALPRIVVGAPRTAPGPDGGRIIPVRYSGLFDNIGDPANAGFFKGKRYYRRIEVTDVFNRPLQTGLRERTLVQSDDAGLAMEEIRFPEGGYGVYYFNVRLYGADDRLAAGVMRAVAVMRPDSRLAGGDIRSGKPVFGVRAGVVPDAVLKTQGQLRRLLSQVGATLTKIVPWRDSYAKPGDGDGYYTLLTEEIRPLRATGIGLIGVIKPPAAMFGSAGIAGPIDADADRLGQLVSEAGRRIGLFMDGWQLGGDGDGSLAELRDTNNLDRIQATLAEFTGGLPIVWNRILGAPAGGLARRPAILEAYFPEREPAERLWPDAAPVFPWLYEPFFGGRGAVYPPERLSRYAPAPAADQVEFQARERLRSGSWISIEPPPAPAGEPNASSERAQLEQMMIRAVYAAALSPDAVFLGDLFGSGRGLLRRGVEDGESVETSARPAFLGASVLADFLTGAEYLGEIQLLPPFEAHAFRRPGTEEAVVVAWHNGADGERTLSRPEIANGPPLGLVDWAGNSQPLPARIPLRRTPSFITGLPAPLALTRMSVRVSPEPPVLAVNRRQNQILEVVNHLPRQAPILFRLRYAARPDDGAMEGGWVVSPEELRINLAPATPAFTPGRLAFSATPDPNSQMQSASPGRVDKSGLKIAQVSMSVSASPPADMLLYLPFRLQSELDVDIEPLNRQGDPHFLTLQLKIRWFPTGTNRRRNEIKLMPFSVKKGQMKDISAFPVSVKALPQDARGKPDAAFESVEVRIPRTPRVQTWVGLSEDGGGNFYLADVTDFLSVE